MAPPLTGKGLILMTTQLVALVLLCLMTGTAMAQQPKVTSLMSKDLTENPTTRSSADEFRRLIGAKGTSGGVENSFTGQQVRRPRSDNVPSAARLSVTLRTESRTY